MMMSLSDHFQDLDPKIAGALRQAVDGLRAEFRQLLAETRGESLEAESSTAYAIDLGQTPEPQPAAMPESVAPVLGEDEVSSPAPPIELDGIEELKHAVALIDRATTQAEVLDSLLAGARRFASRSAVLLLRSAALEGWDGSGFGDAGAAVPNQEIELVADSPWGRLAQGRGGVPLEASDCAVLCDAIGAEHPAVGVLLPLVLGDRVAAALYADRLEGDGSLEISALQLLTFNAGQVLETLPLRNRSATATLRIADTAAVDEAIAVEPEPATATEVAPEFEEPAGVVPEEEPLDVEAPVGEGEAPSSTSLEATSEEVTASGEAFDETGGELVTRTLTPRESLAEPSPAETTVFEPLAAPPGVELEEWPAPGDLLESGVELSTTLEPAGVDGLAGAPTIIEEPEVAPEPEPEPASEPEPEAQPERTTAEVQPPSDLDGPGWAFRQRPVAAELGEEALHEEARRLARLLVTEIKLYNEEQVDMGRQQRDLYGRLREDIERSRQIYSDRIDSAVRDKKDYFHEALVRILAGGDAGALGV
jgi:hypothetical protein